VPSETPADRQIIALQGRWYDQLAWRVGQTMAGVLVLALAQRVWLAIAWILVNTLADGLQALVTSRPSASVLPSVDCRSRERFGVRPNHPAIEGRFQHRPQHRTALRVLQPAEGRFDLADSPDWCVAGSPGSVEGRQFAAALGLPRRPRRCTP
jgi:hypothetical protein